MNWAGFIAGLIWGAVLFGGGSYFYLKRSYTISKKLPYRWVCQRCTAKGNHIEFSNSHWDFLMEMADEHNRDVHDVEGVM